MRTRLISPSTCSWVNGAISAALKEHLIGLRSSSQATDISPAVSAPEVVAEPDDILAPDDPPATDVEFEAELEELIGLCSNEGSLTDAGEAGLTARHAGGLLVRLLHWRADVEAGRMDRLRPIRVARLAWSSVEGGNDTVLQWAACDMLGCLLGIDSTETESVEWLDRTATYARAGLGPEVEAESLGHLGNAYRNAGRLRAAITAYDRAIALARTSDLSPLLVDSLANLAIVCTDVGDTDASMEVLIEAPRHCHCAWAPTLGWRTRSSSAPPITHMATTAPLCAFMPRHETVPRSRPAMCEAW